MSGTSARPRCVAESLPSRNDVRFCQSQPRAVSLWTVQVDSAWVYAVLHDSLGNTRVEAGGAVLLRSGEAPARSRKRRV